MAMDEQAHGAQPTARHQGRDVAPQSAAPLRVRSCNRLGMQANPPSRRLSLGDWLRRR